MSYNSELISISRTLINYAVITLDYCGRTFGVSPCNATGIPCYNTYPTCKYKSAYLKTTKDYRITSADVPLPFKNNERPYLKDIKYLPTEIKERGSSDNDSRSLTISGRMQLQFYDEPDTDIGIDPYYAQRSSIQGTYWKKWLARNPNYKGRVIKSYEGFLGLFELEFQPKFIGVLEEIKINKNEITVECADLLKALDNIEIPPKLDIKLVADIDATILQINLTSIEGLDSPSGYVRFGDEIAYYTNINGTILNVAPNGRNYFGTIGIEQIAASVVLGTDGLNYTCILAHTAAADNKPITGANYATYWTQKGSNGATWTLETEYKAQVVHKAKDKVQKVRYFAPDNGFNHLKDILLIDALEVGLDLSTYVNIDAFDCARDWPGGEINFSTVISEPIKLSILYFELVDLLDCKSWMAENLKITIKRNIPNEPGRVYTYLTDEANIVYDSASVDLNPKSRISRFILTWDKTAIGKDDEINNYGREDIGIEADAEGPNEYDEILEKKFFCRWIRQSWSGYETDENLATFVKNYTLRQVCRQRNPQPILTFDVELKDSGIKTGDFVKITTDEILQKDGNPINQANFQIVKRQVKDDKNITLKALKVTDRRYDCIAPNTGLPENWSDATEEQKEYGAICNNDGTMPDGTPGYIIY